ncbi:MAG: acetylornithine/N-succinyldiaminopimelate aminotransferase [Blastocatellia bacterium]|jgi:acetylornithine aminotransferase/acetylornithine/N-succinyldiaminopimelate aminotransferase|nr:acetylornithine/N-succinyldiaminopimelate aminotransferase [Blastocatellia bacterium]
MTTNIQTTIDAVIESEDRFQLATYKKMPIVAESGRGVWLLAGDGERYLDLYGGHAVAGVGHCHPRVVAALQAQAGKLLFYSNLVYSDVRARAAEKLASLAPAPITKAFFCNSGTEANENAMRMARMATGREQIITFTGGFHGRTADAISATALGKYRELGRPNVPGHLFAEFGDIEQTAALADETVAAIMLEPIQSMAGVRQAAPEFYRALRDLATERGMLLIYDEVQTGVGRTGEWFFAGSEAGGTVVPDIITLAKALGSGVPVGACLVTDNVAAHIKENDLGTTFGGGMLAMAAVIATLEAIEADGMLENVKTIERHLRARLAGVPQVARVRGQGFLLGIEFKEKAAPVHQALLERRIITGSSSDPRVLRLLPPLCLQREEVDLFVDALKAVTSDK